ncbi:unnamed protein product [Lactuca saligna]|uniref:Uncharacterized protein n=1 Tax=Lactuca saligna TaxID=75948 RepID=A0AA35YSZ0_LACSI|nr:unnamed protein product [Lactuca saligna]
MVDPYGTLPTEAEYKFLAETYGLSSADGVDFPSPGSSIMSPPPGKVRVYLKTLNARLRLPLTDFQEEVLQKDCCSIQMLTPNAVNKVVSFEMICRANHILPNYFIFKYFFRFCCIGEKCTFSVRRGGHTLVPDGRTPKNWQDKWMWVNHGLAGSGREDVGSGGIGSGDAGIGGVGSGGGGNPAGGVEEDVEHVGGLVVDVGKGAHAPCVTASGYFSTTWFYAACRTLDRSRRSSRRSILSLKYWELVSSSAWIFLKVPIGNSTGSIASAPYVRLNGDSFLPVLGVVRYDYSTVGSSSAQFPLAFPIHFLILFTIVRLDTFVYPFDRGCATDVSR